MQRTLTIGGMTRVWLVSSCIGLESTKQENMSLFEGSRSFESKPVKLDVVKSL